MKTKQQSIHIQLTLEQDQIKKFRYIANFHCRSLRKEIGQLVKRHIAEFEQEQGTIKLPSA